MSQTLKMRWLLPAGLVAVPAYHAAYAVQYMTVEQAQQVAFAGASEFTPVDLSASDLSATAAAESATPAGWSPKAWEARAAGKRLGWLFVDQAIGKTEAITYALALDANGAIASLDILEYREAHGSEIRMPAWRKQFVGKTAHDALRLEADVKNISGATLSCRHVTDGVRRLVHLYDATLRERASEP